MAHTNSKYKAAPKGGSHSHSKIRGNKKVHKSSSGGSYDGGNMPGGAKISSLDIFKSKREGYDNSYTRIGDSDRKR